jgi:hypothetical protein
MSLQNFLSADDNKKMDSIKNNKKIDEIFKVDKKDVKTKKVLCASEMMLMKF